MVRVTVLASGSKGNCTVVTTSRTRIVIDAGLSCREIVKRMRLSGEEPEKVDAILITHEHQDHVQGLSMMARRWNVPVYATEATHAAWRRWITPRNTMSFNAWLEMRRQQAAASATGDIELVCTDPAIDDPVFKEVEIPAIAASHQGFPATTPLPFPTEPLDPAQSCSAPLGPEAAHEPVHEALRTAKVELFPPDPRSDDPAFLPCIEHFRAGISFDIGDITVTPFSIPHDAADPVGFILQTEGLRIAIATDLGYLPPNVRMHLRRTDLLMLESNHDLEMLRDGPYPWSVKQRVLSRVGHLSNDAASEFLANEYDGGARYVILAHISESNNLPELARLSAERALNGKMSLLGNKLLLASQNVPLDPIDL
ncbi:MAG: MBL fold metallo-hydrolase [Ktedonobacteraceae bacterium]|nr:MBL fold metallo-hydrolase [Ktedonobacteraceae bacterium]